MKCCADDAHFSRQLRRVVGPQVLCAAPFFAVRRPEKCEPVLRGGASVSPQAKEKKACFPPKNVGTLSFCLLVVIRVRKNIYEVLEVINIYQVAGMKFFSQTQSGRLDVRKSGVCGAGLNRNME